MGFKFVDGDRARRLDELAANPPPPPVGAHVRKGRRRREWEVVDGAGRVLGTWFTYPAALRDAERFQQAEVKHAAKRGA